MQKMKKVIAFALACVIVLAMGMTAFAGILPATGKGAAKSVTITTPANAQAADHTFTAKEQDYTEKNLVHATTINSEGGTEPPSTGGIVTIILNVVGFIMVLAALILLANRRRMSSD